MTPWTQAQLDTLDQLLADEPGASVHATGYVGDEANRHACAAVTLTSGTDAAIRPDGTIWQIARASEDLRGREFGTMYEDGPEVDQA